MIECITKCLTARPLPLCACYISFLEFMSRKYSIGMIDIFSFKLVMTRSNSIAAAFLCLTWLLPPPQLHVFYLLRRYSDCSHTEMTFFMILANYILEAVEYWVWRVFPQTFFWSQRFERGNYHRKNELFLKGIRLFVSNQSHSKN